MTVTDEQAPEPEPLDVLLPRPIGFVLGGGGSLGCCPGRHAAGLARARHQTRSRRRHLDRRVQRRRARGRSGQRASPYSNGSGAARSAPTRSRCAASSRSCTGGAPGRASSRTTDWCGRSTRCSTTSPNIEDLLLPYGAVAVDVERGVPVLFRAGQLESALLASAAIPGIFPPVLRDGRLFYDGGLGNNVPDARRDRDGRAVAGRARHHKPDGRSRPPRA